MPAGRAAAALPLAELHWDEAKAYMKIAEQRWYYSRLQGARDATRSALTASSMTGMVGSNAYANRFAQGATIVPRNFFFVEIDSKAADDIKSRVVVLRTSAASEREAKKPWKGEILSGRTEGALLVSNCYLAQCNPICAC
jgi:hypothetical protein